MHTPKYLYKSEEFLRIYEFVSEGPKGQIKKMVQYTTTGTENVYNLAFGDYNEETKKIDDSIVTNNEDSLKVLATVASTVYAFTEKYPLAWVFATGSTAVRTRLYRMGITNNIVEIKSDFKVFGLTIDTNKWEEFIVGEDYEAFLIKKRKYPVMTKIEQLNESKIPVIAFDEKLELLRDKILFPEKLARANEILNKVGLPGNTKK